MHRGGRLHRPVDRVLPQPRAAIFDRGARAALRRIRRRRPQRRAADQLGDRADAVGTRNPRRRVPPSIAHAARPSMRLHRRSRPQSHETSARRRRRHLDAETSRSGELVARSRRSSPGSGAALAEDEPLAGQDARSGMPPRPARGSSSPTRSAGCGIRMPRDPAAEVAPGLASVVDLWAYNALRDDDGDHLRRATVAITRAGDGATFDRGGRLRRAGDAIDSIDALVADTMSRFIDVPVRGVRARLVTTHRGRRRSRRLQACRTATVPAPDDHAGAQSPHMLEESVHDLVLERSVHRFTIDGQREDPRVRARRAVPIPRTLRSDILFDFNSAALPPPRRPPPSPKPS